MIFKKIRKGHADWRNFLCSTPARDYVFQKDAYEDQIDRAAKNIRNTDCVIIGAGAGASTAAGIQYGQICMQPDFIHIRLRRQSGDTGQNMH